jgi:hypothetical protein
MFHVTSSPISLAKGEIHYAPFSLIEKIWRLYFYTHIIATAMVIPVYILDSDEVYAYAMFVRIFVM